MLAFSAAELVSRSMPYPPLPKAVMPVWPGCPKVRLVTVESVKRPVPVLPLTVTPSIES